MKCFTGHSHFISDLTLASNNIHLFSASWDKTIRLWNLSLGKCTNIFKENGHDKEVLSCTISSDNRLVITSGSDRKINLWNTTGKMMKNFDEISTHKDWVSKVRFIPTSGHKGITQFFVSIGWDGFLKIWSSDPSMIKDSFRAHDGSINDLAISPRGNYIVTGGKDKMVKVWDFNNLETVVAEYDAGAPVNAIAFNPRSAMIAVGTEVDWQVWNFLGKNSPILVSDQFKMESLKSEKEKEKEKETKRVKVEKFHQVTSIKWNTTGSRLFVGYSNGNLKVYDIKEDDKAV